MQTGTIKHVNKERGFGFIKPVDGGEDLFVHCSAVDDYSFEKLELGTKVRFAISTSKDGRTCAANVVAIT